MIEARVQRRFPCDEEVLVVGMIGTRRVSICKGKVTDISSGGLLLRFDKPIGDCDRFLIKTPARAALTYLVRHRRQRNGFHFVGVEVLREPEHAAAPITHAE